MLSSSAVMLLLRSSGTCSIAPRRTRLEILCTMWLGAMTTSLWQKEWKVMNVYGCRRRERLQKRWMNCVRNYMKEKWVIMSVNPPYLSKTTATRKCRVNEGPRSPGEWIQLSWTKWIIDIRLNWNEYHGFLPMYSFANVRDDQDNFERHHPFLVFFTNMLGSASSLNWMQL